MRTDEFDFALPERLIAQVPPMVRGTSRMLVLDRATGRTADERFGDLPLYLRPGDLLVLNDSRVLPSRLFATRARGRMTQDRSPDPSGRIEILLVGEGEAGSGTWTVLARPARKVRVGEKLLFHEVGVDAPVLVAEVVGAGEYGERTVRFDPVGDFAGVLERIGTMPLPPYIHREAEGSGAEDRERYQTVYSTHPGSAAAPTAGLHFTSEMLDELRGMGVEIAWVTLHVGLGTFQPVRAEEVGEIRLHAERYTLPEDTAAAINRARAEGRRIVAGGTTTTRTLEHCATLAEATGAEMAGHRGETSIFLSPGYRFRVVNGLLTNFHLPKSTLLMLVCGFAGMEATLAAYRHAVEAEYRFFSYGDCMLIV